MAKEFFQTKCDYDDFISTYMYNNHMSFKTLEEVKKSWRKDRAYDAKIEVELITKSLLFMSLLDDELDLNFRKQMLNHIASYLSVYTSKAPEYASYEDQNKKEAAARSALNKTFSTWLNGVEAAKKNRKVAKQRVKRKHTTAPKVTDTTSTKCEIQRDGTVLQLVTVGTKTHTFTYPNVAAYKQQRDLDCARVMREHHL